MDEGREAVTHPGARCAGRLAGGAAVVVLLPFVAGLLATGCGGADDRPVHRLELAQWGASGEAWSETRHVDFGETATRPQLERGWGMDERREATSFVWGAGPSSVLRFDVAEPRDLTIDLRGWAFAVEGASAEMRVEAFVAGERIGDAVVSPVSSVARFQAPARLLRVGANRLELRYSHWNRKADELPWAVAWDAARFGSEDSGGPAQAPRLPAGSESLQLSSGTAISWSRELPATTRLAWDALETTAGTHLAIDRFDEAGEVESSETIDRTGSGSFRLTGSRAAAPRLVGWTVSARGGTGAVRVAGLRLESPDFASAEGAPGESAAEAGHAPATRDFERDPERRAPNLVVYLIDTLRAHHLGCYGYPLPTSPRIDDFAKGGVRFAEARAQSSWTKPAVATVLTGLYPVTHGAERRSLGLAPEITTLAERLRAAGYTTAHFTTNPTTTAKFGFDQGYDEFHYVSQRVGRRHRSVGSMEIHAEVVSWLDRRDTTKPFFLFVHTLDPHDPYYPGEPYKSRFAPEVELEPACCLDIPALNQLPEAAARERARQSMALYDAEIAANDAAFGALLDELDRRGLSADSAVLLTADHGEEFFDHGGWRHAETLYEEVLRIPFVLRLPGAAGAETKGRVLPGPADQIDIAPTLLDLAGLPKPPELPGGSWLPALEGGEPPATLSLAWLKHPSFTMESALDAGWKWARYAGAWKSPAGRAPEELYGLSADPAELRNLLDTQPVRRLWLSERIREAERTHRPAGSPAETEIDPELDRALRALGYL